MLRRHVEPGKGRLSGLENNTQSTLHDAAQGVEVHLVGRESSMNKEHNYPNRTGQGNSHNSELQGDEPAAATSAEAVSKAGQSHPNSKSQGSQRFAIYSAYQTQRIQPKPGSRMKSQRGGGQQNPSRVGGAMRGIGVQGTSAGLQGVNTNNGSNMQITNNSVVSQRANNFSGLGPQEAAARASRS